MNNYLIAEVLKSTKHWGIHYASYKRGERMNKEEMKIHELERKVLMYVLKAILLVMVMMFGECIVLLVYGIKMLNTNKEIEILRRTNEQHYVSTNN